MAKNPTKLEAPLKYKVLTVLPVVYRKWASLRNTSLEAWTHSWQEEELHSVKGGAQVAWWTTALRLETFHMKHVSVTGGSADLQKAFDEILRKLLYELLRLAGFPERVLIAYISFQECLTVYNAVGEGVGLHYHRSCSIPQGCPLSMDFMAFLMRPWVLMMKSINAHPMVLADDILVSISGVDSFERFKRIFEATIKYRED